MSSSVIKPFSALANEQSSSDTLIPSFVWFIYMTLQEGGHQSRHITKKGQHSKVRLFSIVVLDVNILPKNQHNTCIIIIIIVPSIPYINYLHILNSTANLHLQRSHKP